MTKFLLTYHSSKSAEEHMSGVSPEEMQKSMAPWMAWQGKIGSGLVDFGMPLGKAKKVTQGGHVADSSGDIGGFSIIQAQNLEEALGMVKDHPHLADGSHVEVHEFLPIPGME